MIRPFGVVSPAYALAVLCLLPGCGDDPDERIPVRSPTPASAPADAARATATAPQRAAAIEFGIHSARQQPDETHLLGKAHTVQGTEFIWYIEEKPLLALHDLQSLSIRPPAAGAGHVAVLRLNEAARNTIASHEGGFFYCVVIDGELRGGTYRRQLLDEEIKVLLSWEEAERLEQAFRERTEP